VYASLVCTLQTRNTTASVKGKSFPVKMHLSPIMNERKDKSFPLCTVGSNVTLTVNMTKLAIVGCLQYKSGMRMNYGRDHMCDSAVGSVAMGRGGCM